MTAVIETDGLGKRYGRPWALRRLHAVASRPGTSSGLVGPNGAGKTTLLHLAVGLLAPTAGTIEVLGGRPRPTRRSWPGSASSPRTRRCTPGCRSPTTCSWARASTRAGTRSWRTAGSSARPGPRAEGRDALRRSARPARADAGDRQAARAADPRRAGGQPRPAGPAGVPAGPDGGRRRAGADRRAVLAPGRRPGAGLRLPDRARRLAGAGRRAGRRAAGVPPPARPARAATRHAAGRAARSSTPATPTGRARCWCAPTARSSTRPGPSPRSAWRTWCWPT